MKKEPKRFPQIITLKEREEILLYLEERFGLPASLFEEYEVLKGATNYWLFPKNSFWEHLWKITPETVGLIFLRRVSQYLKPTSTFLQRFGRWATKNVVHLSAEEIAKLKLNRKIKGLQLPLSEGYVALKYNGWVIGCGLYTSGNLFAYLEEKILKSE